jgi:hypothetical protein
MKSTAVLLLLSTLFIVIWGSRGKGVDILLHDGQVIDEPLVNLMIGDGHGGGGENTNKWTFRCFKGVSGPHEGTPLEGTKRMERGCNVFYTNTDLPMLTLTGHHAREVLFTGITVTGTRGVLPLLEFIDVPKIHIEKSTFLNISRPFSNIGGVLSVRSLPATILPTYVTLVDVVFDNCDALRGGAGWIASTELDISVIRTISRESGGLIVEQCCRRSLSVVGSSFTNGSYMEIGEIIPQAADEVPPICFIANVEGDLRNAICPLASSSSSSSSFFRDKKEEEGGGSGLSAQSSSVDVMGTGTGGSGSPERRKRRK